MITKVTDDDLNRIYEWAARAEEEGSRFPAMTYEQGIAAMVELILGNMTVDELLEEE